MPLPTTSEGLKQLGWVFKNEGTCRCGAPIEWWITPSGRNCPMKVHEIHQDPKNLCSPVIRYERISHFADCPEAASFRRKG